MDRSACTLLRRAPIVFASLLAVPSEAGAEASDAAPQQPAAWEGANRVWLRIDPYVGVRRVGMATQSGNDGGALVDVGAETATRGGLLVGCELAPLAFTEYRPHAAARFAVGHANEDLAISMEVGARLSWEYPELGPLVRIGRLDETHATVHVSWSVYPPVWLPIYLDVAFTRPITRRWRLDLDVGGGYAGLFGVYLGAYGTAGVQYVVSGDGKRGTTLVNAGVGTAWMNYSLGPMFTTGIERIF
jgi:hypothetical protein